MKVIRCTRQAKGKTLDVGASGVVEILPCGNVIKSPWIDEAMDSREELALEHKIYKKLGPHPRLVGIIDWNPQDYTLTMEHMQKGNLHNFILLHGDTVTEAQRLKWAEEAAEGLQLLHSADVIHCDVKPKNLLLDAHLGLKIADFSGSSLEGSKASACNGRRFSIPDEVDCERSPMVKDDLFALGTTIYFIMTMQVPFPELSEEQVIENYRHSRFPDVSELSCGEVIQKCWTSQIASAKDVCDSIRSIQGHHVLNIDCVPVHVSIKELKCSTIVPDHFADDILASFGSQPLKCASPRRR